MLLGVCPCHRAYRLCGLVIIHRKRWVDEHFPAVKGNTKIKSDSNVAQSWGKAGVLCVGNQGDEIQKTSDSLTGCRRMHRSWLGGDV